MCSAATAIPTIAARGKSTMTSRIHAAYEMEEEYSARGEDCYHNRMLMFWLFDKWAVFITHAVAKLVWFALHDAAAAISSTLIFDLLSTFVCLFCRFRFSNCFTSVEDFRLMLSYFICLIGVHVIVIVGRVHRALMKYCSPFSWDREGVV